jgi:hypothetical protein
MGRPNHDEAKENIVMATFTLSQNFTRTMLANCYQDLKAQFPGIKPSRASVTGPSGGIRKQYFFQFDQPGFEVGFSTWVTAEDRYDARCKAWGVWMEKNGRHLL